MAFDHGKFKSIYRYLVQAAMEMRCVPYIELQNVFGVSRKDIGHYAGRVGDYCLDNNLPLLNALIVTTSTYLPNARGFQSSPGCAVI